MYRVREGKSAVGEFAAALYGRGWPVVHIAMLACFDASGHESDQPFLVVAGFVSSAGDWDDFSMKWKARLEQDALPYFHATEFERSEGAFKGWKGQEGRRQALCRDLMDLIVRHAYRLFVQAVQPDDVRRVFTEAERREFNMNSYALCGRACVADLGRWTRHASPRHAPELVFEDGDLGKGRLRDLLVEHGYQEPQFRPGKKPKQTPLGTIEPFLPLQAADWLAYEAFRLLKGPATEDRDTWRWPMRQFFQRMQGVPGAWLQASLERVRGDLEALRREDRAPVVLATAYELRDVASE